MTEYFKAGLVIIGVLIIVLSSYAFGRLDGVREGIELSYGLVKATFDGMSELAFEEDDEDEREEL